MGAGANAAMHKAVWQDGSDYTGRGGKWGDLSRIASAVIVAIVGSRAQGDANYRRRLRMYAEISAFVRGLPAGTFIVSGGAPGADRAAAAAAGRFGLPLIECLAEWRDEDGNFERAAGYKRNALIVDIADVIHAWWDGKSRGTASTISLAKASGKHGVIHTGWARNG